MIRMESNSAAQQAIRPMEPGRPGAMMPMEDGASVGKTSHQRLEREAQRWVSQTFFGTLLRQMRNSPLKSDLLSGGRGADAFYGVYDQHLADRMARAAGRPLVGSIVRRLEDGKRDTGVDLVQDHSRIGRR